MRIKLKILLHRNNCHSLEALNLMIIYDKRKCMLIILSKIYLVPGLLKALNQIRKCHNKDRMSFLGTFILRM